MLIGTNRVGWILYVFPSNMIEHDWTSKQWLSGLLIIEFVELSNLTQMNPSAVHQHHIRPIRPFPGQSPVQAVKADLAQMMCKSWGMN